MDAGLIDLIKVGGLSVGAVVILIKLIDFLRWFLGTIPDALKDFAKSINDFAKSLKTIADNQTAHDAEIATLQTSTTSALTDLKVVIQNHGKIVESTIKGQDIRDEHLVSGLIDTTNAISETGTDVKRNANANTEKIIEEVKKLPSATDIRNELDEPFRLIREDISKLIDPDLATKVVTLIKPDVINLIETALKTCLDENAKLAKELDHADKVIDVIVKPTTPDDPPPSPDGSGAKQSLPDNVDIIVTLPRVDGDLDVAA